MQLHTLNKSPRNGDALASCLRLVRGPASILLLENGVYGALAGQEALWSQLPDTVRCYVLQEDLEARGLAGRVQARFESVDYAGFVALCAAHDTTLSWY